jgi:hypothetical protein
MNIYLIHSPSPPYPFELQWSPLPIEHKSSINEYKANTNTQSFPWVLSGYITQWRRLISQLANFHFHILDTKLLLWLDTWYAIIMLQIQYRFNGVHTFKENNTPLILCKPKSITFLMRIPSHSTTCFSVAHQTWTPKTWETLNFNKVFYALLMVFLDLISIKRF